MLSDSSDSLFHRPQILVGICDTVHRLTPCRSAIDFHLPSSNFLQLQHYAVYFEHTCKTTLDFFSSVSRAGSGTLLCLFEISGPRTFLSICILKDVLYFCSLHYSNHAFFLFLSATLESLDNREDFFLLALCLYSGTLSVTQVSVTEMRYFHISLTDLAYSQILISNLCWITFLL